MAVKALSKNTGLSVKKLKPIIDLVRGMPVNDALNALQFIPSPAAARVAKVVKSAAANAEIFASPQSLKIVEIYANEGPSIKRFRARARGRAARIIRRSSHITVVVDEKEGQ